MLGGGQLGRMLALAGIPLGELFTFLDPNPAAPAAAVGRVIPAAYDDRDALAALAGAARVVTYEFERVPAESVALLRAAGARVEPGERPLAVAQDRLREKELFVRLGIPVPRFHPVDSGDDLERALGRVGTPAVVKTRAGGYDGKGQVVVSGPDEARPAAASLDGRALIVEELVRFQRELSVLAARGRDGDVVVYPLVENVHREGILRVSRAPAPGVGSELQRRAEGYARALLEDLDYVGVLALEMFERDGELLGNEIAPRVHNSGHWTIEGAVTSQFENHVRAITGLPLGDASARGYSLMVNAIGEPPPVASALHAGGHVHVYGKEARPGRKVGHVTFTGEDPERVEARAAGFVAAAG